MRLRRILGSAVGALAAGVLLSSPFVPLQRPAPDLKKEPAMKPLQTPNDAVLQMLAYVRGMSPFQRQFVRALWIQDGAVESGKTSSLALNYISRASAIFRPPVIADGHLVLVDLRTYAPRDQDVREWLNFWECLQFDPAFSLLITKDTINFAGKLADSIPKKKVVRTVTKKVVRPGKPRRETRVIVHRGGPYAAPDDSGRRWDFMEAGRYEIDLEFRGEPIVEETTETVEELVPAVLGKNCDVLRFNAVHIDPIAFAELQRLTCSQAPVVEHRYFKSRALRTIKDSAVSPVFAAIFGGLYYEFRGIRKAKDVLGADTKATDLDVYLESLGIGNIRGGLSADRLFDRLRSDQKAAIFRSGVTGKPREVLMFHVPSGKEGNSWGSITGDIKDAKIDIGDRSYANLLNPRRDAREGIFPRATDLDEFTAFNGDGALQDEVPFDVALDHQILAPHSQRLQPAISCLRCHYNEGSDGWKPVPNDVKTLLDGRLDLFGDLSQGRRTFSSDTIDRLAGLYAGDFSKNLRRNRDDVAEATLKATGPWRDGGDQTQIAKFAAVRLTEEDASYNYDLIDCHTALREMGLEVDPKIANRVFRLVVPPDLRNSFPSAPGGFVPFLGFVPIQSYVPEDPVIGALRAGLGVNRADWALKFNFAAERAQKNFAGLLEAGK